MNINLIVFLLLKTTICWVSILGPEELRALFKSTEHRPDGFINASLSNFGKIPYGFNLVIN